MHYFESVLKARTMTSLNSMSMREMTPSWSQEVKHFNTLARYDNLLLFLGPRHACNKNRTLLLDLIPKSFCSKMHFNLDNKLITDRLVNILTSLDHLYRKKTFVGIHCVKKWLCRNKTIQLQSILYLKAVKLGLTGLCQQASKNKQNVQND